MVWDKAGQHMVYEGGMMNRIKRSTPSSKQAGHERVIAAVKHALDEGHYEGGMLPSYRQLARDLDVTMSNVRRAMAQLESEGLIKREVGRGTFPRARRFLNEVDEPSTIQCINFVTFSPLRPSFVEADYLTGYTEILEHHAVRMRFLMGKRVDFDYSRLHSPALPFNVQGVVLINIHPPYPIELMEWLRANNVPFVIQHCQQYATRELPPHFGVYVNKSGGAVRAVNHLLELGHCRIGFMGSVHPSVPSPSLMFDGYRGALIAAGLDCAEEDLAHCEAADRQTVLATARSFLDRRNRPTAVLASGDEYALALLDAAHALRIRVPEELSIIGSDNQLESEQCDPPLTTLSIPRRELARDAVELLFEAANTSGASPYTRILETHLVIRETTAPPRAPHRQYRK